MQAAPLRLNHIQVIGTHNSYHIAPHPMLDALIRATNPAGADSLAYTHRPLPEQLGELHIRQIELDLYADPKGGHFAEPKSLTLIKQSNGSIPAQLQPAQILSTPGFKILHNPDFDYLTRYPSLKSALQALHTWSANNRHHIPILILLELKEKAYNAALTQPIAFNRDLLLEMEKEILSIVPKGQILTPDDIRGDFSSLRQAVLTKGWPSIESSRGKFMFAMDNEDLLRDLYLEGNPSLENRLLFVSVNENHPAAAFFKINDPTGSKSKIQRLVKQGFLVRTRADAETQQARDNNPSQRDDAFESGAQFVSTDYPEPDKNLSLYCVQFSSGEAYRVNPISRRMP